MRLLVGREWLSGACPATAWVKVDIDTVWPPEPADVPPDVAVTR